MTWRVAAALLAASGCSVEDKDPASVDATTPEPTTGAERNIVLVFVDASGSAVERNAFATPDDVYFAVRVADPAKPVVAEDYVFQVAGVDRSLLSSDDFACRRFHVNAHGTIDGVHPASLASGAPCTHDVSRIEPRALAVQAMPFATGGDQFVLRIGTAGTCLSDAACADAIAATFEVAPPAPPTDEEQPPPSPPDDDDAPPPPPPDDDETPPPDDDGDNDNDNDDDDDDGNRGKGQGKGKN